MASSYLLQRDAEKRWVRRADGQDDDGRLGQPPGHQGPDAQEEALPGNVGKTGEHHSDP